MELEYNYDRISKWSRTNYDWSESISSQIRNLFFSRVSIRDKSKSGLCLHWIDSPHLPSTNTSDPILSKHHAQTMPVCYFMNSEPLIELIILWGICLGIGVVAITDTPLPLPLQLCCHSIFSSRPIEMKHNSLLFLFFLLVLCALIDKILMKFSCQNSRSNISVISIFSHALLMIEHS